MLKSQVLNHYISCQHGCSAPLALTHLVQLWRAPCSGKCGACMGRIVTSWGPGADLTLPSASACLPRSCSSGQWSSELEDWAAPGSCWLTGMRPPSHGRLHRPQKCLWSNAPAGHQKLRSRPWCRQTCSMHRREVESDSLTAPGTCSDSAVTLKLARAAP